VFAEVVDQFSVDIPWDLGNPNVRRLMNDLASNVAGINETTRQDVQRTVVDALDEGVPLSQLQERLTGLFEETYRGRAMTVARSESQVAYNRANVLGYEESGQIAYVELLDNRSTPRTTAPVTASPAPNATVWSSRSDRRKCISKPSTRMAASG
jgi:hypothetical protein